MLGIILYDGALYRAVKRQFLQQQCQLAQCIIKAHCPRGHILRGTHHRFAVLVNDALQQLIQIMFVHRTYHVAYVRLAYRTGTHRNRLIQQTQGVSHRTHRRTAKQLQRGRLIRYLLGSQYISQMIGHLLCGHIAQYKLQAAAQHGNRYFMRISRRQNKFHMLRRLFQRFEHGIKGRLGEHVHLVDDIDFVFARSRRVLSVFQYFADIIDTCVGCGVDFQQIDKTAAVDFAATAALAARLAVVRILTIQTFGQNPCDGGLTHSAGTG